MNNLRAKTWLVALGAVAATLAAPAAALAQDVIPGFDPGRYLNGYDYDCRDFRSQAETQAVLRVDPSDPNRLGLEGDGIACESNRAPFDRIAVPRDFTPRDWVVPGRDLYDCTDFLSQAETQAVLRVDPRDPNRLDGNRNGVACEDYPRGPYSRYPVAR